jgi:hypothetical protein
MPQSRRTMVLKHIAAMQLMLSMQERIVGISGCVGCGAAGEAVLGSRTGFVVTAGSG